MCLLTFKALHGLAASCLADLCRPVVSVCSRQRLRSATPGHLVISSTVTNFSARLFAVAGPKAAVTYTCDPVGQLLQNCSKDISVSSTNSQRPDTPRTCNDSAMLRRTRRLDIVDAIVIVITIYRVGQLKWSQLILPIKMHKRCIIQQCYFIKKQVVIRKNIINAKANKYQQNQTILP